MNGQDCGSERSQVQVYVYKDGGDQTYSQTKLSDPANYAIRGESAVPPGDCIIIEFGPDSPTTDKLCEQYGLRDHERCTEFGVEPAKVAQLCTNRQVTAGGTD